MHMMSKFALEMYSCLYPCADPLQYTGRSKDVSQPSNLLRPTKSEDNSLVCNLVVICWFLHSDC